MAYIKNRQGGATEDELGEVERERLARAHRSDATEGVPVKSPPRREEVEALERMLRGGR